MKTPSAFSNRLEEWYRILSESEKRDINRYLSSPFLNRDKSLLPLHEYLCKHAAENYNKNAAWKFIFPKSAYNEKKFRYMVSDLGATLTEFVYANEMLRNKPGYVHVLDEYFTLREAEVNKAALSAKILNRQKAKAAKISSENFLENHFENELVEELQSVSRKTYSKYIRENRKSEPSGLDAYYVVEKLRQMCLVENDNNVFGTGMACFYEKEILHLVNLKPFRNNEFVKVYAEVFQLLKTKKEQHYFLLKNILKKSSYDFETKNLAELFTYARNFCIAQINSGKADFYVEIFDLYEQGLQKRILLVNGEINEQNYKNIVTTALRIKKADWALRFINDYHYLLNKTVRENAFNYNLANYYFHIGEYDKALRNLQKVQLADLFYGLDARSLTLKCYFELDEKEAFLNAYFSFRIFIMRKKNVSEQHRRNYQNFLRIAKRIMNLRVRDKKAVQNLQLEIQNLRALADKNWLEEKLKIYLQD